MTPPSALTIAVDRVADTAETVESALAALRNYLANIAAAEEDEARWVIRDNAAWALEAAKRLHEAAARTYVAGCGARGGGAGAGDVGAYPSSGLGRGRCQRRTNT